MAFRYKKNQQTVIQSQFRKMDARLQFIALAVMGFTDHVFGKDIVITEIYRSKADQMAYYPGQPYRPSVHEFGRGIDFGVRAYRADELDQWPHTMPTGCPAFDEHEIKIIDNWFSGVVSYDDERPDMDSLIHHNVGLGDHLHLQVSWRKSTRLKSECNQAQLIMKRLGVTL